jgi:hypothetical protein
MIIEITKIKPAAIYADLTEDDICEMMAEAAHVDRLMQSGRIATTSIASLAAAAFAVAHG